MENIGKKTQFKDGAKSVLGLLKRFFKRSWKYQKEKKHHVVHVVVERDQDNS